MDRYFAAQRIDPPVAMEMRSNETIKQAVMAGMGISFLSAHTVGLELAAGKLAILDVVGLPIMRDWYVIHLREKRLAPIAAAFRSFLLERGAGIIHAAVGADLPFGRST
jgi:DNA-binding transcriptional LysR family regulator